MRDVLTQFAVVVVGAAALGACGVDSGATDETDTGDTQQAVESSNRITQNALSENHLQLYRMSAQAIAGDRIGNGRYALGAEATTMLEDPGARELLTFTVGCALDKHTTLVGTAIDGTAYEFAGELGLAQSWARRSIGDTDQRWISSCLLSRVNAHDISLLVSLRGPDFALFETPQEARDFTVEEGAFFGQVFVGATDAIETYACMGRDQAAGEPATGPLHDRDCTEETTPGSGITQCGFHYVGTCADYAADAADAGDDDHDHGHHWGWGNGWGWGHEHWGHAQAEAPHACEGQAWTGYYEDCHTADSDAHGKFPAHTLASTAITVFLTPQ